MRVVLTSNFSPWSAYCGGGQRSTHALATALAREGHDVTVVFTRPPWERFRTPSVEYKLRWASFFALRSRGSAPMRPLNAISVAREVRRLHQEAPLRALHGNGEEVLAAVRWARSHGITVVTTPRYPSYPEPLFKQNGPGWMQRTRLCITDPKYLLLGRAVRQSTWCCPTSQYAAQLVLRGLAAPPDRLRVIPNGVSDVFFDTCWAARHDAPILYFGRLALDKGLDTLLRSFAKGGRSRRLLVIGRGNEKVRLRRLASELGIAEQVAWLDWMGESELALQLAGCSMAVLPSRHESFGNTMAETLAVGAPLVTTRAGSIPELVQHEVTGLLVPVDAVDVLHGAISRLESDSSLARRLGAAGRQRMLADYRWRPVARRYAKLYATNPES